MEEELLLKEENKKRGRWAEKVKEEVKEVAWIAGPLVAATVTQYLVQMVSMMMVGHVSELALAGASLATSLANVTGFSLLLGMAGGLETLCGQAFGAKQYQKVGIYTCRAIFFLAVVCLPTSILWIYMEKLLVCIGQDPLISKEAGKYAIWLIPGLFGYAAVLPLQKFLQSQSLTMPLLLSSVVSLIFHVPFCWLLVFKIGLRSVGAALSVSLSTWFMAVILGLYIWCSPNCKTTRAQFSVEVFRGIGEFFRVAIPSTLMTCLEWWSFELIILLSGLLPNPKLETSVLSVCMTTANLHYTVPFGIGAAASTRVSNELGAGNPEKARMAVHSSVIITATEAVVVSGTLFGLRDLWGYAYSNEKEVTGYVSEMTPFLCFTVIFDCIQGVLSGVARGCGWQDIGAFVNLGAFYLVGLPAASVLGFVFHLRGKGLWFGMLCGSSVQTVLLFGITTFTNWQRQAEKARERVVDEKLSLSNTSA